MTQVIRTVLEVDASKAVAGFGQGEKAVQGYERAVTRAGDVTSRRGGFEKLSGSIRDNRAAWDDLSSKALIGGAAIAGGLGLATKAAIDWESAWAGVNKTVDGTPAQMAELETGLRDLAKTLPSTHEEIAGVAEAAGQLGVARGDILKFTETAIALGESTNLTADEAATSLAKFSNIMGTVAREGVIGYEKLGSTLVALGNDGASTEADIMSMSLRLAGAGKQIGATEADILAMSNALTSVGIEAELGGGAMSRAMLKMNSAVISGGDELDEFAKIAGVSASEFATAWREDPIQATNMFVSGLGEIGEAGGDAAGALDDVGLKGTQNAQVLLRAAGASDLLSDSLKLGATAWDENAALAEEAGKRYATTESQLKVARNQIKDAAIDIGGTLAPIAVKGAEAVAGIANAFGSLPGPVQSTITGIAGVTSGMLLLGGATVKAVGWTQDMGKRLDEIGMMTPRVEKGLKGAATGAKLLGQALAITAAVGTVGSLLQDKGSTTGIQQLTKDLLDADDAVTVFNKSVAGSAADMGTIQGDVTSFGDALKIAFDPGFLDNVTGGADSLFKAVSFGAADMQTSVDESTKVLSELDGVLTGLVAQGRGDIAAQMFGQFEAEARKAGVSTDQLKGKLPGYTEAVAAAGNQSKLAGDGAAQFGTDVAGVVDPAQQAEKAVDDLVDAVKGLGSTFLDERGAARDYEAALDDMAKSIEENGTAWGNATPEGRANMEALEGIAKAARDSAAAILANGGSVEEAGKALDKGAKDVDAWAKQLNVGKGEVADLKDEVLSMDGLEAVAELDVKKEAADKKARDFKDLITGMDGGKAEVTVAEQGATEARDKVLGLRDSIFGLSGRDVEVTEHGSTAAGTRVLGLDEKIINLDGKTVTVKEEGANPSITRLGSMKTAIANIDGKTVEVTEIGSTAAGGRVVSFKNKIYEVPATRTSNVGANVTGQGNVDGLRNSIYGLNDKTVTVTYRQVTQHFTEVFGGKWAGGIVGVQPMAEGGVVDSYRKQLPAGSVAPGLYPTSERGILMAEDKRSKWESYIPERPDLRGRAEAILAETARRFGKQVIPMASGGIRSYYTLGEISEDEWYRLRALGWKGRAGDNVERIYRPKAKPKAAPKRAAPRAVASKHAGRTYVGPGAAAAGRSGDTPLSGSSVGLIDYDRMGASVAKHIRALPPTPLYPTQRQYARATKDALDRWEGR